MKPGALVLVVVSAAVTAVSPSSQASGSQPGELPSAMVVAKSSNKNEVHYAVAVDEACAPAGASPVRPYWRMLERGSNATEPLTESERRVLGLQYEEVVPGDGVIVALRAMPARAFDIHTLRGADGRCSSWVGTKIGGVPARLERIYVQQRLFGSVDYVLLAGAAEDGKPVRERVSP
jgi:hypothetical protein